MTGDWPGWCHTFTARVDVSSIVTWETQHHNANLDCFTMLTFAGDLADSKSTLGGVLRVFGSHTFVLAVRSCRETNQAEVISLDAGLRPDGMLALSLWDNVIDVFEPTQANGDLMRHLLLRPRFLLLPHWHHLLPHRRHRLESIKPLCNSAWGWTVWSSGRFDP